MCILKVWAQSCERDPSPRALKPIHAFRVSDRREFQCVGSVAAAVGAGLNQTRPARVSDLQTDMHGETCITGAHRRTQTRLQGPGDGETACGSSRMVQVQMHSLLCTHIITVSPLDLAVQPARARRVRVRRPLPSIHRRRESVQLGSCLTTYGLIPPDAHVCSSYRADLTLTRRTRGQSNRQSSGVDLTPPGVDSCIETCGPVAPDAPDEMRGLYIHTHTHMRTYPQPHRGASNTRAKQPAHSGSPGRIFYQESGVNGAPSFWSGSQRVLPKSCARSSGTTISWACGAEQQAWGW